MSARLLHEDDDRLVIEITVSKSRDFLQCEDQIQDALNHAGALATQKCLEDFDSDGTPIIIAGQKLTAKRTRVDRACPGGG
jgi:hypothetical protein